MDRTEYSVLQTDKDKLFFHLSPSLARQLLFAGPCRSLTTHYEPLSHYPVCLHPLQENPRPPALSFLFLHQYLRVVICTLYSIITSLITVILLRNSFVYHRPVPILVFLLYRFYSFFFSSHPLRLPPDSYAHASRSQKVIYTSTSLSLAFMRYSTCILQISRA